MSVSNEEKQKLLRQYDQQESVRKSIADSRKGSGYVMKRTIHIDVKEPQYLVNTNVTFAQVPGWCGHMTQDLKMDIIFPREAKAPVPCIVWICGGAWLQMSTCAHLAYLTDLARCGYAVASVQYRTSNEAVFPAQLMDVKAAIRYLRAHADRYHIDPRRFGVMGESAGGHLTAMTALTGNLREFDQGDYLEYSSAVQAACPWYVPSDVTQMPVDIPRDMQAAPESLLIGKNAALHMEEALKACPVTYVTENAPPFLILHGLCDRTVPFQQGEILHDRLAEKGNDVTLLAIEEADHADRQFFQRELWKLIEEFFREKLTGTFPGENGKKEE